MKRGLDERIADWVDGRLSPRDQERLEAEFRVNSKLREQAEEYRETVERVRRALSEPGEPVNLVDRVMERVQLDHARPGLGKALPFLASFAAAAAMILLFIALYRMDPAADQGGLLDTASAEADPDGEAAPAMDGLVALEEAEADEIAADPRRDRAGGERLEEMFTQAERREVSQSNERLAKVAADEDMQVGAQAGDRRAGDSLAGDKEKAADLPGEGQAAGKAAGTAGAGEALDLRAGQDRLGVAAPGAPIPEVAAPEEAAPEPTVTQASRSVALSETAVWVQGVVGEVDNTVDGMDDIAQREREVERQRLGQGLPPVPEDNPNLEPTTPVVVFNLPPGQELQIGQLEAQAMVGGRYRDQPQQPMPLDQTLADLDAQRKNAEAKAEANAELKDQNLQQTIDQALLPMSNALPAQVDEYDANGLSTLQSTGGFAYRSPEAPAVSPDRGFVSSFPSPVAVAPNTVVPTTGVTEMEPEAPLTGAVHGRAFRVQGDRQQVAQVLRQLNDWGRAQGAAVEVGEVADNLVPQNLHRQVVGPPPADVDAQSRARQDAQRPANRALLGVRGDPVDRAADEISVLVLFQSGATPALKKNK